MILFWERKNDPILKGRSSYSSKEKLQFTKLFYIKYNKNVEDGN